MESIKRSPLRVGNFTSSEIYNLMGAPKPCATYIEEKNMERRLGRSLSDETNARPLVWGSLLESRAFGLLGLEYKLCSDETLQHPEIDYWCGSCDGNKFDEGKTVIDIKCPMTLKSFCQLVDCKTIDEIRDKHKDGEKYYWQLVSNAIITNSRFAELIIYMPCQSELVDIRIDAGKKWEEGEQKYYWIRAATDDELPYLIDGGYYKNINIIRFEVPEADKDLLISKILLAKKDLINFTFIKQNP